MINSVNSLNIIPKSASHPKNSKLSIFYVNDMHGNIDNMSGMIAASDKFDKEAENKDTDTLKLSAGDNFSGGDEKKNKLVVNLLSRMGINASAVGNHEFDSTIKTFYGFLNPNKTKFLAANATGQNDEFYKNVQKSTIVEVNGTKYGLIGLLPFDLETTTGKDPKKLQGIESADLEDSINIVNDEVKKLQSQGTDRIILVSHIGNENDREIAPRLHGVDVIVGGHSHTEVKDIKPNENLFKNADNDPVVIVQTGENAKNVGVLNIEFDEKGVLKTAENNLIKTSQEKSPVLNYFKEATLGKSPQIGTIKSSEPLPKNRRIVPCAWTNLIADAMKNETGADIAFINASNTRKVPQAGVLTERDVSESTPLKNTLIVKEMSEKEIVNAISEALKNTFSNESGEPGILHTSGLSYTADINGNLKELYFVDKNGNKTQIDINNPSDKPYHVCYDSFVLKGTEYPAFMPEKHLNKQIEKTYDFDKDKLAIDYIKKLPNKDSIEVVDDKRIQIFDNSNQPLTATRSHNEDIVLNKKEENNSKVNENKVSIQTSPTAINNLSANVPYGLNYNNMYYMPYQNNYATVTTSYYPLMTPVNFQYNQPLQGIQAACAVQNYGYMM